ncbi:MAG TPA: carbohydrate ABC transporter permease [Symbiobacteriaceae bacterium]|nr:carbohydrate ABC transporter permease [Symbiobacteriaceae bacterium]
MESVWKNPRLKWAAIGFHLVLGIYALIVIYPLLVMLLSSIKSTRELITNPYGWPTHAMWSNYAQAWKEAKFAVYFKNSIWVTVAATTTIIFCASMASYVLGRVKFKLNPWVYGLFMAGLVIPGRLAIIPLFLLIRDLHLLNTHAGLILIYTGHAMPFAIFLLTTFFRQVPHELEEAAVVEGAGRFTIYWRIMLPLVRPALATVAIFEFLHIWNDFFYPLVFLRSEKLMTIPVGLSVFFGEYATNWALLFAALAISILPVVIIFIAMSKQFIAGLTAGAIK